jgi:hypothetical protein
MQTDSGLKKNIKTYRQENRSNNLKVIIQASMWKGFKISV